MMKKNVLVTAICTMAVIFIGNALTGCVTSRHIDELKSEHRALEQKVDETNSTVGQMETIISESAEAAKILRNDVSTSNDQLREQMYTLLENYNELLRIVQEINAAVHSKKSLTGSVPGGTVIQDNSLAATKPAVTNQSSTSIDCGTAYDEAFILVRREEYDKAIIGFSTFLTDCPNHNSVENAHYWIGECFYAQEKFVDAVSKFEFLLKNFKSSVNASRAMYKLGRCQQELGRNKEAKDVYTKLVDDYPETLEASQAKERLKDLK